MGIILWIIFGAIAGAIAKYLMPGNDPGGWVITIILGIVGAFVGGYLGQTLLGTSGVDDFDIGSLITAIVGAIVVLFIYRLVTGRSRAV